MIELIAQQFKSGMSANDKLNVTRDFLQILCLKIMDEKKLSAPMALVGGTALRVLYDLRRFSEDLDFSVVDKRIYDLTMLTQQLTRSLQLYGITAESSTKTAGAVNNIMLKFSGLLQELEISPLRGQKLSIRLEIDTNPPRGWQVVSTIVNRIYLFSVLHYDLASLFAGKLHGCFFRRFTKGRDFYDFVWYVTKKVKPNFVLLNNAIKQTHPAAGDVDETNFKDFLLKHLEKVDFDLVRKDIERFLEDKSELSIFTYQGVRNTVDITYGS